MYPVLFTGPRRLCRKPLATAVISALAFPALAQDTSMPDTANANDLKLEEVIVTGVKRPVSRQEYAGSLSAIDAQQLQEANPRSVVDLAAMVPGFNVLDTGARNPTPMIVRGVNFAAFDANDLGGDGETVATYVNNMPLQGYFVPPQFSIKDVSNIEVLRGPQGTLYGASSLTGLLRYETQRPLMNENSLQLHTRLSTTDQSDDINSDSDIIANIGVLEDTLALRMLLGYQNIGGFIDNDALLTGAEDDINDEQGHELRLSLNYQPTERLNIFLMGHTQESEIGDRQASNASFTGEDYSASSRYKQPLEGQLDVLNLEIRYDWDALTLMAIGGYYRYDEQQQTDETDFLQNAYYYAPDFTTIYEDYADFSAYRDADFDVDQNSLELRLLSNTDGHIHWLAGVFYSKNDLDAAYDDITPGLFANYLGQDTANDIDTSVRQTEELTDAAIYAEVAVDIHPAAQITVGGRYFDYGDDITVCASYPNYFADVYCDSQDVSDTGTQFKLAGLYRLSEHQALYLNISEGFRRGGANYNPTEVESNKRYDPDTTLNYELGFNGNLLQQRLQLNAALFYIEWSDIRVDSVNDLGYLIFSNANDAVSQGLEVSVNALLSEQFSLQSSYAYANAYLSEDALNYNGVGDNGFKNDRLPGSPKDQVYLGLRFTETFYHWGVQANLNAHYSGAIKTQLNDTHLDYQELGGYTLWHANVFIDQDHWRVGAFINNLTNKRAVTGIRGESYYGAQGAFEYINRPRTVGIDLSYRF